MNTVTNWEYGGKEGELILKSEATNSEQIRSINSEYYNKWTPAFDGMTTFIHLATLVGADTRRSTDLFLQGLEAATQGRLTLDKAAAYGIMPSLIQDPSSEERHDHRLSYAYRICGQR
jgi:hypothetical protein